MKIFKNKEMIPVFVTYWLFLLLAMVVGVIRNIWPVITDYLWFKVVVVLVAAIIAVLGAVIPEWPKDGICAAIKRLPRLKDIRPFSNYKMAKSAKIEMWVGIIVFICSIGLILSGTKGSAFQIVGSILAILAIIILVWGRVDDELHSTLRDPGAHLENQQNAFTDSNEEIDGD